MSRAMSAQDAEAVLWGQLDFDGVRMTAVGLDRLVRVALAFVSRDEELPVLCCVQLQAVDGVLIARATDRFRVSREVRQVNQRGMDWTFLLRRSDAVAVRALIKAGLSGVGKEDRPLFPADLRIDYAGLNVRVGDLDVHLTSEVEQADDALLPFPFPAIDSYIEKATDGPDGPFNRLINPELLSGLIVAAKAGHGPFRIRAGEAPRAIVARPTDPEDDLTVLVMPLRQDDETPAESPASVAVDGEQELL